MIASPFLYSPISLCPPSPTDQQPSHHPHDHAHSTYNHRSSSNSSRYHRPDSAGNLVPSLVGSVMAMMVSSARHHGVTSKKVARSLQLPEKLYKHCETTSQHRPSHQPGGRLLNCSFSFVKRPANASGVVCTAVQQRRMKSKSLQGLALDVCSSAITSQSSSASPPWKVSQRKRSTRAQKRVFLAY